MAVASATSTCGGETLRGVPWDTSPSYRFGSFRLSPAERALTHGNTAVVLPRQLFDLLLLLVREDGRLVPRERIVEAIWPNVTVSEANLRQRIWQLRRTLRGFEPQDQNFIETVPRHGYRFVAAVTIEMGDVSASVSSRRSGAPGAAKRRRPGFRLALVLCAAALLASDRGAPGRAWVTPTVGAAATPAPQAVAILRLRTHSGDPADGWIADAFTEMLRAELEGTESLRLVPAETIEREAGDLSPPRVLSLSAQSLSRLRERTGGDTIVAGSLVAAGPGQDARLRVDLLVQCTRSRAVTAALTHNGVRRELPELATRVARDLRRVLSEWKRSTAG